MRDDPRSGIVREPPTAYATARRVSATEAARNFSDLLNRVRYRGEVFVVERGGSPICELRPVAPARFTGTDLVALLASLPPPDDDFFAAVEEAASGQPKAPESPWER